MKARYLYLLIVFAAFLAQTALAQEVSLPIRAGQASATLTGSFAVCLNPANNFAEVACSTKGAHAFPFTALDVGYQVSDAKGNSCQTAVQTVSDFPVDISPPGVVPNHSVGKVLDYDPSTGTGDSSFIGYTGGKCVGASFDKTGATEVSFGTVHFTVSENGNRVDSVITSLQDPVHGIGDFSLSGVLRVQQTSNTNN
jgi:hypothetical protein